MQKRNSLTHLWLKTAIPVTAVIAIAMTPMETAHAFQFESGGISGNFDTTLSVGASWRLEEQDLRLIGTSNGGLANSVNVDDGNLNYDKGDLISSTVKATHDLELNYSNLSVFMRGSYFYDHATMKSDRARTPLGSEAEALIGRDAKLLDAYLNASFELGDMPLDFRIGNQVLNWGESTFIQNGINSINTVDVTKLRIAGAELREALEPVAFAKASLGVTDNFSIEAFYQLQWQETTVDPTGTYFSANDFAGPDGRKVILGFGAVPDATPVGFGAVVSRSADREAKDGEQFGFAAHLITPSLGDTEFGFYFANYHSRLPLISATTGTFDGVMAGDYQGSASYFIEYPDNIKLYGLSFNADLGDTGVALQGEISVHQDMPLQVDDTELLFAALSPPAALGSAASTFLNGTNQLGTFAGQFSTDIHGYRRITVSQAQSTATKVFGPTFGSDQIILLGEVGATYANLPSKSELRFNAPGTHTSGNPTATAAGVQPATTPDAHFADSLSWGYRLLTKWNYNNAIAGINLSPRLAFAHDVKGNSPGPGGSFVESRKKLTLGLSAIYQNSWTADIAYARYFGAGEYNMLQDRDFIGINAKYSF
ncbi:MAG: DUF1302 domain-containing protein [Mariprofundaceae bacterium]